MAAAATSSRCLRRRDTRYRLHGQDLKADDGKAQELRESDTHSATDAAQDTPYLSASVR